MSGKIEKAAILGSGVMGSAIAAHFANAGIPSVMLDIVPREPTAQETAKGLTLESPQVRNRFGNDALKRALKSLWYAPPEAKRARSPKARQRRPRIWARCGSKSSAVRPKLWRSMKLFFSTIVIPVWMARLKIKIRRLS